MFVTLSRNLLYAAFLLLPFTFIRVFYNLTLSDILITLSFIFLIISNANNHFFTETVLLKNKFLIPLIIFSIGFFLSLSKSIYPIESLTAYLQVAFIFLIAYPVLAEVVTAEKHITTIAVFLIIPGVLLSIIMIMLKIFSIDMGIDLLAAEGWRGRLTYGGMEPSIPGRIMLQNIPFLAVFILLSKRNSIKIISAFAILIQLLAVFLTSSRSGFLIFIIGFILFAFFLYQSDKKIKFRYILSTLAVSFFIIISLINLNDEFYQRSFERYGTILQVDKSGSSLERLKIIDEGFNYINRNPFTGLGMGNSFLYTEINLHNPILISWLENGIFGLIGFSAFYLILLFEGFKCYTKKFFGNYFLLGLAVVMVMMVFGDMFMANSYKRVLWLPALLFFSYAKSFSIPGKSLS